LETEPLGRAFQFLGANGGEAVSGGNAGVWGDSKPTVGGDRQIDPHPRGCVLGEDRTDTRFVIGMSEDRQQDGGAV
jgi:hypothetical protein